MSNSDNSFIFSCSRNAQITFSEKPQLKIIGFQNYKHWYLIHTWSDQSDIAFNGTIVNRALLSLNGVSLRTDLYTGIPFAESTLGFIVVTIWWRRSGWVSNSSLQTLLCYLFHWFHWEGIISHIYINKRKGGGRGVIKTHVIHATSLKEITRGINMFNSTNHFITCLLYTSPSPRD